MDGFAKELRSVVPEDEAVYGGKAVGLGRLFASGALVPDGFALAAQTRPPAEWAPAQREALRAKAAPLLARGAVAVRSSAPGEDAASRSFAGQFESVLGVTTEDGLFEAAARCIRSGATERVRAYAGTDEPRPVGLVVQVQVRARSAGVCFTVDPSGRDRALLIEAVRGTGDALVAGHARPERWRVYHSALDLWEAQREAGDGPAVLAAEEAAEIARGAAARADAFGRPLDLEWARDESRLWWLQARPITAAAQARPLDVERYFGLVDDGPVTVWANWNVRETMPEPFTPLNWSLWRDIILPVVVRSGFGVSPSSRLFAHVAAIDLVEGRIYWNMNGLLGGPMGGLFAGAMLAHIDARAAETTRRLQAEGILRPRRMPASRLRLLAPVLWRSIASTFRLGAALRPRHVLRVLEACAERLAARPAVSTLSDAQLMQETALLGAPESREIVHANQMLVIAFAVHAAGDHIFRDHPRARRLLTAGVEGNPTTEISLGVDELVEAARPLSAMFAEGLSARELLSRLERSPEGAAWKARLGEFLRRFGQRCPNEFDIATPRWADDPTMIVRLVRAGLGGAGPTARERLARMAGERRQAVAEARARSAWWRRPLLSAAARLVELYAPLREAPKHYAMVVFRRMRLAVLELGGRLVARGLIDAPEDVMFLDRVELESIAGGAGPARDLRALVAQGRAGHQRHLASRPPDFVRSDGVPVVDDRLRDTPAADGSLRGLGASTGRATGRVRILRAPDPAAMADGDVLVVEFADPGWTPLFPRAGALVMEVGGLMCHAAVVARELGVPAVFGVPLATERLVDGQTVTVDGDAGTVTPARARD